MTKPKIIIIPGNGGSHIDSDHWYGWLRDQLVQRGYEVIAEDMPDPVAAHMNIWLPHIESAYGADANTIIVGHSSGGVAGLRYLEDHQLLGLIAVGVNHTDLGFEDEKASGYYDAPWQWAKIKSNASWIVQFASTDDPYMSVSEPRFIHDQLSSQYHEFSDRGHFMIDQNQKNAQAPEILDLIISKTT